jgi:hypothetical protein
MSLFLQNNFHRFFVLFNLIPFSLLALRRKENMVFTVQSKRQGTFTCSQPSEFAHNR